MAKATRVLIASAATGNGHVRAGEALKAAAQIRQPTWRVEHLDVLTLAPRWVRLAYGGGFELLAAHAPRVWGGLYRWADGPQTDNARWAPLAERTVFSTSPSRPVIALVGGGLGISVEENLESILGCDLRGAQVIVVCGRNEGARARLEQRALPEGVQIVGFVSRIERLIAAADLVITKPGGLTTSEALAVGRPLVLTRPLPGHEEGNVSALLRSKAAVYAESPTALRALVNQLLAEPERLSGLAVAAAANGHADAAETIIESLGIELRATAAA